MNEQSPFEITQLKVLTEVSVFGCSLLDHPSEILLAKSAVEELREQYPESAVSNVMAEYMSPWKSHLLTTKLEPLIKLVAEKIKNSSIDFLNTDLTALNYELIFSGSLPHHVPATKGKRVIVAINYIKIPFVNQG